MAKSQHAPHDIFRAKEGELKSLKSQYFAMQSHQKEVSLSPSVSPTPWMFSTMPQHSQPLAMPTKKGDQILRLKRILEEEYQLKKQQKEKGIGV